MEQEKIERLKKAIEITLQVREFIKESDLPYFDKMDKNDALALLVNTVEHEVLGK